MPDLVFGTPRITPYSMFAFESITVSTASVGLTEATFDPVGQTNRGGASYAYITVETDSIRARADGGAATSASHLATTADTVTIYGQENVRNFRAIRVTNDATIRVSYGR